MRKIVFSMLHRKRLHQVRQFSVLPFTQSLNLTLATIEMRWLTELASTLVAPGAAGIIAEIDGKIRGLAVHAPLPWDSSIIGKRMCALKQLSVDSTFSEREHLLAKLLGNSIEHAMRESMDFILLKTESSDAVLDNVLASHGFQQMDTLLCYVYQSRNNQDSRRNHALFPVGFNVRLAEPSDAEKLVEVTRVSFAGYFGRYHADPHIGREKATKVYEEWMRSCLAGWADWTLLLEHKGQIAGYSSWKKPSPHDLLHNIRLGQLSIIAIHPDYSQRGLATCLIAEGMKKLSNHVEHISVLTHINNIPMQRAVQKLGWELSGEQRSYHKWL